MKDARLLLSSKSLISNQQFSIQLKSTRSWYCQAWFRLIISCYNVFLFTLSKQASLVSLFQIEMMSFSSLFIFFYFQGIMVHLHFCKQFIYCFAPHFSHTVHRLLSPQKMCPLLLSLILFYFQGIMVHLHFCKQFIYCFAHQFFHTVHRLLSPQKMCSLLLSLFLFYFQDIMVHLHFCKQFIYCFAPHFSHTVHRLLSPQKMWIAYSPPFIQLQFTQTGMELSLHPLAPVERERERVKSIYILSKYQRYSRN